MIRHILAHVYLQQLSQIAVWGVETDWIIAAEEVAGDGKEVPTMKFPTTHKSEHQTKLTQKLRSYLRTLRGKESTHLWQE